MAAEPIQNTSVLSNPQTLQQWLNLIEGVTGSGTTNTSGSSSSTTTNISDANDPIKALLAALLPGASGGMNNPQAQQLIQAIFTQFKEGAGGLSGIQAAGNAAGVYNSSTQGLLANDAMARAIAQSAGVVQKGQNDQQQVIAQLLSILANSSRTTNQTGTTNSQSSKSPSSAGSALGKMAAGALGANALKKLLDKTGGDKPKESSNLGQGSPGEDPDSTVSPGSQQGLWDPNAAPDQDSINEGLTRGLEFGEFENNPQDPFSLLGYAEDGGMTGANEDDPFGVGGWDIGDFVGNDAGSGNGSWDFIEPDAGDSGGSDFSGFEFGGDY